MSWTLLIRWVTSAAAVILVAYAALVFFSASKEFLLFVYVGAVLGIAWVVYRAGDRAATALATRRVRSNRTV